MNEKKGERETEGIRTKRRMKGREIRQKKLSRPSREPRQMWSNHVSLWNSPQWLQIDKSGLLKNSTASSNEKKNNSCPCSIYFFSAFVQYGLHDAVTGHDSNPKSIQLTVPEPRSLSELFETMWCLESCGLYVYFSFSFLRTVSLSSSPFHHLQKQAQC